jgi:hypothetical protein
MKTEKLRTLLDMSNAALKALDKGETSVTRELLRDMRGMLQQLGDTSPIATLKRAVSAYTTPNYFPWSSFWNGLAQLLERQEFAQIPFPALSDKGTQNFEIESKDGTIKTFLLVTWYKMESGKHEFVAYIHP